GFLRRREEACRNPPDGNAEAADRDHGRDRLGPRHRRAAGRRRGRSGPRIARNGRSRDHALPADPEFPQARFRSRVRRRPYRGRGWSRARREARARGLRGVYAGGGVMTATETEIVQGIGSDYEVKYGFKVPEDYFFKSGRGLSHELIDAISSHKDEPDWMR